MVQIYCYCYNDKTIWNAHLYCMNKIFIREFGHEYQISFLVIDEQQKAESTYPLKLGFHQEDEFMTCIKQEFQLFNMMD